MTPELVHLPLDRPPRIVHAGLATHGHHGPLEQYRLQDLWSLHLYRYRAELSLDGHCYTIRPGDAGLTPPGVLSAYGFRGTSQHGYVLFKAEANESGGLATSPLVASRQLWSLWWGQLERLISVLPTQPRRAEAELWQLLWAVHEQSKTHGERSDDAAPFEQAVAWIELNLEGRISPGDVSEAIGVSHNHLTRLFQRKHGTTVVAYLRRRRAERAQQLLLATDLPVKVIAVEVGVPDLQQFNKLVRRELGFAPRELRENAGIQDETSGSCKNKPS